MKTGRPREFDPDTALDRALDVFWRHGYEGATLEELTTAMGINRPSLYAAFGSKEGLFRKALDRYIDGEVGYIRDALALPTARAAVAVFAGAVRTLSDRGNPGGCLIVQGALACGEGAEAIRKELAAVRERSVAGFRERFERAKRDREVPADTDCDALARYITAVLHGLSVQSATGATRAQMERVVQIALRAWPA